MNIKYDLGHIWIKRENFDLAINYPPFYKRPYAMISITILKTRYALWFGKHWMPHILID